MPALPLLLNMRGAWGENFLSCSSLSLTLPVCCRAGKAFQCFCFKLVCSQAHDPGIPQQALVQRFNYCHLRELMPRLRKAQTQQNPSTFPTLSVAVFRLRQLQEFTRSFSRTTPASSPYSLRLMRLFYKGPGYKLSWARDVNYSAMMEALLHYAWKCPTGEKMAYSQGRMDGGMNNGWRDGGEKHQCNLCLTKLKSGPGERPWCWGPSGHVSLRFLRWTRELAQEGV